MTPGARLSAAIGVLDGMAEGAAAEAVLTRWARGARYAGSGDRAAVRDIVYDVLRQRESCALLGGGRSGRALVLGHLRLVGRAVEPLFSGEGHAPAPLSAAEAAPDGAAPDAALDIPVWLRPAIGARAPGEEAALFTALAKRAPVWVRVNLRRGTPAAVMDALAREGIVARPDSNMNTALEITENARRLRQTPTYLDGLIEPQDLSVQRALAGIDWPQTGRILDYCAGGGGKALALADQTGAQVFAHDADPGRMRDLPVRAARAGVQIPTLSAEAANAAAPFDAVLCDVPCSGTGTWRRDPEAKWRLTLARVAELCATQDAILDAAVPLTAPGGLLVYMTCSLLEAENEARIAAFLARHRGWICTAQGCDTPLTASDGFFHAVLRRK